jgi:hypothetical protein
MLAHIYKVLVGDPEKGRALGRLSTTMYLVIHTLNYGKKCKIKGT